MAKLFELRNSEAYLSDDPKAKEAVTKFRADLKALEVASLTPQERFRAAIEARSQPLPEELAGTAPWLQGGASG